MKSSRLLVRNIAKNSVVENLPSKNVPVPRKPRRKPGPDFKMLRSYARFVKNVVVPYAESLGVDPIDFVEPLNQQVWAMLDRSNVVAEEQRRFAYSLIGPVD
ncbi:hypothetical protein [Pseudomonas petrae]|uniref:Uncharacterized protein n=1 Tax=Pseudomonas petrae TaxID=2912190 RepID=A0ABS9ICD5_9PSED|nr:hypothetical protein [Pseudomonas petrae]MCF7544909.1 hypothetical protein [Pseudomonas petrae]